jgi:hypothetical protein
VFLCDRPERLQPERPPFLPPARWQDRTIPSAARMYKFESHGFDGLRQMMHALDAFRSSSLWARFFMPEMQYQSHIPKYLRGKKTQVDSASELASCLAHMFKLAQAVDGTDASFSP